MRTGHGLAAHRNAGGWAQSVHAGMSYARTSKPLPCRSAALPQVDPVGPALLRGPQAARGQCHGSGRCARRDRATSATTRALARHGTRHQMLDSTIRA